MSKRLRAVLRGIDSVPAIAPGLGVADYRERVRRDFERVAADLHRVLDRAGDARRGRR